MTEPLPPYVPAAVEVVVRVKIADEWREGVVLGWRGERVYVRYRTERGGHLTWVPAADVERVD